MRSEKGNYKGKHASETIADPVIQDAAKKKIVDGTITCGDAENIARSLAKSMLEVGTVIDLLETPIVKCQLGLFGYQPQQKIVTPAQKIAPEVEKAVRSKVSNGQLSCYEAWEIAKALTLPRMDVSSLCEAKGIKIGSCQLGAF